MKKYIEKLKSTHLNLGLWKPKGEGSTDSPESGWSYKMQEKKKEFPFFNWIIIALPIIAFLSLGIYFVVVDVKILTSVVDKEVNIETNSSEASWWETSNYVGKTPPNMQYKDSGKKSSEDLHHKDEGEYDEDPNLIVQFDYVDLSSEDIPKNGHFIENVLNTNSNNSQETIIILKNDDNGKKIFLKTSATFGELEEKDNKGDAVPSISEKEKTTTTAKTFVYSPTIPQSTAKKPRVDVTTKKYNHSDESTCFSTKLSFCEGILPYDVVQLPNIPGVKRYSDLTAILPYFQMIIDSGCSLRAREFICSVLEPECQPEGLKQSLPCKLNCKVVSDDCTDFILQTLPLSKIFDCRRYPDWDENQDCLNISKGKCHEEEFQCSDGTCIPSKWVCDGVHDCPGSRPSFDESNCQGCSQNEFRCVMDGKCVPLHWKCDGQIDCTDHSDEMSC